MAEKRENVEIVAKTVDEAVEQGLAELGLTRDQAEVEVVNPGRSGLLGLGSQDAVVRVSVRETEPEIEPAPEPQPEAYEPQASQAAAAAVEADEGVAAEIPFSPVDAEDAEVADMACGMLQGIIDRMGIKGEVVLRSGEDLVEEGESPPLILDVTGKDLGILIGRQGETLQALQYLTRLMLSRRLARWEPVVVDVESYRARRRRSLRRLATRMADRVSSSGRRVVLETMPAYERRIVHLALRDHAEVVTKSVGEGDNRKVTILPK